MGSPDTSSLGSYDDGVYEKIEAQSCYTPSQGPRERPPKLPAFMLASLILLLIFCFIGILVSGLHFGHKVTSPDCLGQSWVMFSSILGLLYISLHLQAARRGEPVNRQQPCSQNPLHSAAIVIARLDVIAWAVSLIVVSVAVSKNPVPVSCANLAACTAAAPAIFFILCVDERNERPFDLPYLTTPSSTSIITCRVSALMATDEVSVEDSISRRGSSHSSTSSSRRGRPNSHTQHAAAIAAANSTAVTSGLGGPRPPPKSASASASARLSRPRGLDSLDERTKQHEPTTSVPEAGQTSEARPAWVGGPRALALSDKARQMGVLPPPVCLEPKFARRPGGEADKENAETSPSKRSGGGGGGWRMDWGSLAAETGYNSTSSTPASTPGAGSVGPIRAGNRCLSPVAEVDDRRLSGGAGPGPDGSAATSMPARRLQTTAQYSPPPSTTGASRGRYVISPRSQASSSYTHAAAPSRLQESGYSYDSTSVPRPPPRVAGAAGAAPPARARLARAQEALRTRGGRDTVVLLNRPRRLTGERRTENDQRSAVSAPDRSRPELFRMPGSFEDE